MAELNANYKYERFARIFALFTPFGSSKQTVYSIFKINLVFPSLFAHSLH